MPTLPNWTPWMGAVTPFDLCGVTCCKSMSPRTPPVKSNLEKDDRPPGFEMAISFHARIKIFAFYWLPVIIYCLAIFIQSSYPATESLPAFSHADKLAHAGAYTLLGFLFYRAFQTTRIRKGIALLVILSAMASSLYGISDEIHQYFVPSRTADIFDMAANTTGSFMGAIMAQLILRKRS
jgi:VanZ family protein